jgi:hypothetical protein
MEGKTYCQCPPMTDDDPVQLWVVLKGTGVFSCGLVTRKYASDQIRQWYNSRQWALNPDGNDGSLTPEKVTEWAVNSRDHLKNGTIAYNVGGPENNYATCAWAVSEVVGMYTLEVLRTPPIDPLVKEQNDLIRQYNEQAAEFIKLKKQEQQRGEEWREGDDHNPPEESDR